MPKVLTERHGRTLLVSINRPDQRNCVDGETAQGLNDAVDALRLADDLDVMVLTGAVDPAASPEQSSFCSGADLKNTRTLGERRGAEATGPMGISRITQNDKPVIAAVNGYCTAGGLELACWCDFRIAAANAQFGVLNRRWGVPLVDGGTQRLPRIVGLGNALYLIETGALIDAGHAQRIGLAQEVVPEGTAVERALEIAETMSQYPQLAIRNDRRATLDSLAMPLAEGLDHEVRVHRDTARDPKMAEWLQRFAKGERPPPIRPPDA